MESLLNTINNVLVTLFHLWQKNHNKHQTLLIHLIFANIFYTTKKFNKFKFSWLQHFYSFLLKIIIQFNIRSITFWLQILTSYQMALLTMRLTAKCCKKTFSSITKNKKKTNQQKPTNRIILKIYNFSYFYNARKI